MTDNIQDINIGSAPNDGTGDPLRTGGSKINDNFDNLQDCKAGADATTTSIGNRVAANCRLEEASGAISATRLKGDSYVRAMSESLGVKIGEQISLNDAGSFVVCQRAENTELKSMFPITNFNNTGTTRKPYYVEVQSQDVREVLQSDNTGDITGTSTQFTHTATATSFVSKIYLETGTTVPTSNVNINIYKGSSITPANLVTVASIATTDWVNNGEMEVVLDSVSGFISGQLYTVVISSTTSFSFKADTSNTVPWFAVDRAIYTEENIATSADITGMAFAPVVTTITSDVTITADNYDTYFGDGDFAIIQMFNSSGTISVDITEGVAPQGARLRIKHFDPTAQAINPWNLEIAGGTTEHFQHPHRDALEQDVVGEMDSAYEWRLSGYDWLLDTSYVHDQFDNLKVQKDGVQVGVGARTLNFTGSVDVTGSQLVKTIDIDDNYVDSLTVTCENDVITVTLGRTGSLPDLTASCNIATGNGIPALSSLTINIDSRVDLNTDLNNARTITFNASQVSDLTALTLLVTTGDNKTLTIPTSDGAQSQSVTLSGIDTSSDSTLTFQLQGTVTVCAT